MSEAVIRATELSKTLGRGAAEVQAVRNVSLQLRSGEIAMLMGPSGSGKTTLLSMLGCMLAPTSGTVEIAGNPTDGANPEQLAKLRRDHLGFVFQTYHLFPTLTAMENVQLALDVRDVQGDKAKRKAEDALARVGLSHKLRSYPLHMSGGEQQRVAIARAIVAEPAAVLADEPTAALDGENGQAIMSILAAMAAEEGHGVLVVTHDSRLMPFADRIIFIEDGRLVGEQMKGAEPAKRATAGGGL